MDFHQLLAKMQELDQPVGEAKVEECGEPMGMSSPPVMPQSPMTPPPSHPSMSVNLNAQGMDNIEDLLKLITKVNPDASKDAGLPALTGMPSLTPPGVSIGSLGNLDAGPLKMLPDLDSDKGDMPGDDGPGDDMPGDKPAGIDIDVGGNDAGGDNITKPEGDLDNDGDHDMDDHDMEKDDEDKEEAYENEPDTSVQSVDYMNNQLAGGMNRPKDTFPKVAGGDNPMQRQRNESGDLRAQIRAELLQRLAEAKGAK